MRSNKNHGDTDAIIQKGVLDNMSDSEKGRMG